MALLAGAGAAPASAPTPPWSGLVTYVSDGDSLWVQPATPGAKPVEIRMADIDAPEICQAWGRQARAALKEEVGGKTVTVRVVGRDSYGRMLARLLIDGRSIDARLVLEGHAWSNRTRRGQGPLVEQEKTAATLRRGLHAQPGAMLPKEFRRSHGPCPHRALTPPPARR